MHKIVLTGGPCAGKTTALAEIKKHFTELGFRVLLAPETATTLFTSGLHPATLGSFEFQSAILDIQRSMEDAFEAACIDQAEKYIVVFDRGLADTRAYTTSWQALLKAKKLNMAEIFERYDAIVHLTSVAVDYPEFYTTENNSARQEQTPEAAVEADKRTSEVWLGHPHIKIVPNYLMFGDKLAHLIRAISKIVGVPEPIEVERKYIVEKLPEVLPATCMSESKISQTYLKGKEGENERVRAQEIDGGVIYTHTIKVNQSLGTSLETERIVTPREYLKLLERKDPARETIIKRRKVFIYKNQYLELDIFEQPVLPYNILEIELTDISDTVHFPDSLIYIKEVTGDSKYSNSNLARLIKAK